jgi:hypothetical protein
MVILEGLKTNFPSVLFVIDVMADMGVASCDSEKGVCAFAWIEFVKTTIRIPKEIDAKYIGNFIVKYVGLNIFLKIYFGL